MKVSLITTCKNSAATIEDTIKSIASQTYLPIEYIIVDGVSTDGTLDIINKYKTAITKIISEEDKGIYFGINKGINLSTGDIVGNLNSDDFYPNSTVIADVVALFEKTGTDAVYGDLHYVDSRDTNKIIRNWKSGEYSEGLFLKGWMPPHPTFFVKRSVYQKYGLFNTDFTSAADYELMLRFIHKHKIKVAYLPKVLVKMRVGGKSNITIANRIKANMEDRRAWTVNNITPTYFTLLIKPLSKLKQFFS